MNEQQIQELKNLVDKLQSEGFPQAQIQAQVDAKKQEFLNLGKKSPAGQGAPAEVTAAPDMEFKSENGSSGFLYNKIKQGDTSLIQQSLSGVDREPLDKFNSQIIGGQRVIRTSPLNRPTPGGFFSKSEDDIKYDEMMEAAKGRQYMDNADNVKTGSNQVLELLLGADDVLKNYSEDDDYYKLFGIDLKGKNIVEKNQNDPAEFEKIIKTNINFSQYTSQNDIDISVRKGIENFLALNKEKEFVNDLNTVNDNKRAGTYEPIIAKGIQNSLIGKTKYEQEYITINNQIRNLILERDNTTDQNKFNDYQSQIKELKIKADALSPSIKILKGKDMFINPLNGKFTDPLLNSNAISYEDSYNDIIKTYQNKTLESLENEFFLTQSDRFNLAERENKKYRIYVDKAYIQEESKLGAELEQAGYEIKDGNKGDKTGYIDNISYNDLMNLAGDETDFFGLGFWENITIFNVDGTEQDILGTDFRKELYQDRVDLTLKEKALDEVFLFNIDPTSDKVNTGDVLLSAGKQMVVGFGKLFGNTDVELAENIGTIGSTRREELDVIYSLFNDANIKLTDEQKAVFERGSFEELAENLGGFAPDLFKFWLLNKGAGAVGITARIQKLMKINPAYGHFANAMLEGVKFQAVTGEFSKEMFTEGALFYGGSATALGLFNKLGIQLTGKLAGLNKTFQTGTTGGLGMMAGSETAAVIHEMEDVLLGNKALMTAFNDMYGDADEVTKRLWLNGMMGSFIPLVQMNKVHYTTMANRRKVLREIQQNIIDNKYKGSERDRKVKLAIELKKDIDLQNSKFDALDIKTQAKAAAEAREVLNQKEPIGEQTAKELADAKKEAQKTIDRYEVNKVRAKKQINKWGEVLQKSEITEGQFKVEIQESSIGFDNPKNKAEYVFGKNGTHTVRININEFSPATWKHEIGHVFQKAAFKANPKVAKVLADKIRTTVNEKLKDQKFIIKDKKGNEKEVSFEEAIKDAYKDKKSQIPEEYIMNVIDFLSQPKYKDLLVDKGLLLDFKRLTSNLGDRLGFGFSKQRNFTKGDQLLEFMFNMSNSFTTLSPNAIKSKFNQFKNLKIDGNKLLDLSTGKDPVKEKKASKELETAADARAETLILKQRQGVAKTPEGKRTLEKNIQEQYNKLALKALGFNVQKSIDAKSLGLTDIQLKEALSFVGEYYTGIKERYNSEFKVGEVENVKFSTFVNANIRPKRQLFYEQALGKGREATTRITEETKELADTSTTPTEGPKLIEPLEVLAPKNKFQEYLSKYESGLKNVDLSKQDYSTLKDAAPNVTKEIFGGKSFKEQQDFINKNLKTIYDLFPLSFRRMTEGTKSSTKIQRSILDNFYITGGRAKMDVGTAAGLPIKAKMPFNAVIPEGPNKGKKVSDLFKELVGIDVAPNRNQRTFVKSLQAEIGKAITNRVARQALQKQSNTKDLIDKLADGKSDVLASRILETNSNLFEIFRKNDSNLELMQKNAPKAAKEFISLVENAMVAFKGIDNAVNYVKDFQATTKPEFKNLDLSNIQSEGYKAINVEKAAKFAEFTRELVEYLPKWIKDNKTLAMGLLTTHYRTNMEGISLEKLAEKFDAKTGERFYEMPEWTKTFDKNNVGKKGQEFWEGISQNEFKSIDVLKGAYKKAHKLYEQNKIKEGDKIIENAYNKLGNSVKKKIIDAWGNSLEAWLNSSKTPQQRLERAQHIMLMGRQNTNVHNGLRQLVPIEAIFTGKLKPGEITKLEHTSPMAKFALEFSQSIVEGNWQKNKNNIIDNYNGIVGPKRIFDIIDAVGKKTNPAGLARMMFDPMTLKMFKTVDSGFKKSLYDQFIKAPKNTAEGVQIKNALFRQAQDFLLSEYKKYDTQIKEQQLEVSASRELSTEFNKYLEKSTGIGAKKVFNQAKADARAAKIKKSFGDYFIPAGAEDFAGLMHKTLAKGKQGEKQLEFYQKALYEPYNLAVENITRERTALSNDFRALKNQLSNVPKTLKKFTKGGDYTNEQAVRVAVWNKLGYEIPGISKTDLKSLVKEVNSNPELNLFANELIRITKGDGYAKPKDTWASSNIAMDMASLLNTTKRTKHLEVWQNNVDQIFSKENLLKLKAAYGQNWVDNVTKTLDRMKSGQNRRWGGNVTVQKWNDWVNGSVGAIMFLNTRSAVLQTISNINYINFSDNNPLQAAKAFANQKQYWKDFKDIFNSEYLKDRRGGNKININESELALAAEKGGVQGTINLLLNKGFIFTKIADSFAIASGGATMYRNRLNRYKKEGMSEKEAAEKAFLDFKEITERTQQSSRPDKISEQQAGGLGRFMLAFANTPMQYNRIIKRNAQDLIAGRGDKKEKITQIIYYSTIQNFIFNALQKALFATAFGVDDTDEKETARYSNIGHGMADSLLRGSGLTGNAVVGIKNIALDIAKQSEKPNPDFQSSAWKALTISPPLYSKFTKLRGAGYSAKYITKDNLFDPKLNNPALSATAQLSSAAFNFPLDRALRKAQNIEAAMSEEAEWWQSTALLMGWGSWELGMPQPSRSRKKTKTTSQVAPKPKRGTRTFKRRTRTFNRR
jgi:hypothetical protein